MRSLMFQVCTLLAVITIAAPLALAKDPAASAAPADSAKMSPGAPAQQFQIDTGVSTLDIPSKHADLYLTIHPDKMLRGLLVSSDVELKPAAKANSTESEEWRKWSRTLAKELFESLGRQSRTPGQVTVSLVVDPRKQLIVRRWGTMFPCYDGYTPAPKDKEPAASPETRDQFLGEVEQCITAFDHSWFNTHEFPATRNKLKEVRLDVTFGADSQQFPRHDPLDFGVLARLDDRGRLDVMSMQSVSVEAMESLNLGNVTSGATRAELARAIADRITSR